MGRFFLFGEKTGLFFILYKLTGARYYSVSCYGSGHYGHVFRSGNH